MNLKAKILLRALSFFLLLTAILNSEIAFAQATVTDKIEEVYGPINGEFFRNNPDLIPFFTYLLENRVQYLNSPLESNEKYEKLANIPLNNKYNTNLKRDIVFDAVHFNPLKYQLNFYSRFTQIYRIDNQTLIVINPSNLLYP
jgi:hypothetical protein